MYTTVQKVREFSGFDDPSKISASVIAGKIAMADARINGALKSIYTLPLPYHRENTITFSGAGAGSGTLTITINSTNYDVAITSGLTASQAADLFRVAAKNSDDFITLSYVNDETNDAIVTIISKTDSTDLTTADAEVNITSAGSAAGMSSAAGTRQDRYPQAIEQLSAEISSALLFMDNYGIEAQDTSRDGVQRLERLEKTLKQIQNGDDNELLIQIVDEVTGEEIPMLEGTQPQFYNTNVRSADTYDGTDGTQPNVDINQNF